MFGFAGFFGLAVIGHSMNDPATQPFVVAVIEAFTLATPLLSLVLARKLLSWLLKASTPSRADARPAVAGLSRRFLTLTAALPFGGLFIPLWIYQLAPSSQSERAPTP